jgi:Sulfotransferase domain
MHSVLQGYDVMWNKVFGVGLSTTGTSSLTVALNRLGIKSIHYPHDQLTHEQLRNSDYHLRTLDDYQGVTDISVAPYFAQLDQAWPGSKFILTVREKESWLRSAELHWRFLMADKDRDPQFRRFTEFILACAYGVVGFSRERLSYVYDTHVRNVLRYFHSRPDDLLVMDICGGDGWDALCAFLGLAVPNEPFPHSYDCEENAATSGYVLMRVARPAAPEIIGGVVPSRETNYGLP